MAKGSLSLAGLADYLEDLAAAAVDVDAAAQRALSAGGAVAVGEMDRLVPVDKGALKAHLAVSEPAQDGNYSYVDVGILDADKEIAIYGNVQEYGSSSVAAQPYIRPALKKKALIRKAMQASLKSEGFV